MRNLPQRVVDVATIKYELKELWEQMTEVSEEEDQQALMRACVANLVVYSPGRASSGEISQVIAEGDQTNNPAASSSYSPNLILLNPLSMPW